MKSIVSILFFVVISTSSLVFNKNADEKKSLTKTEKELPPPISIQELKKKEFLRTTSGVLPISQTKNYCNPKQENGFYGFYFLLDKKEGVPFGKLTIYTTDQTWEYKSEQEKFIEINLKSNKIAVWDSIAVGLSEQKLLAFIKNRPYYKKAETIFANLGNYNGEFTISNNVIKELTININCDS